MALFLYPIPNPYWAAPCPRSGLLGCDCSHESDDDTALCDTPAQHVADVRVSASRFVDPRGIREIVAVGCHDVEPVHLTPDEARALALILLDVADTAEVPK
jgi:hypothetical protein